MLDATQPTGMRRGVRQPGCAGSAGQPLLGRADPAQHWALQHRPGSDSL